MRKGFVIAALFVGVITVEAGASNQIDVLVNTRLQQLKIQPSPVCSDPVFLRRVYLDVIGTVPTEQEAREFLDSKDLNKRQTLIETLLKRDEFADYWTMKWCDLLRVKAEFPINLWPNAAQAYHHWVHASLKQNKPYNQFVRELLTANGSNFRDAAVNFFRATQNKNPQGIAEAVALTFLGERADKWPQQRLDGLAAFFTQVGFKSTSEWKEEIVFWDPGKTNALSSGVLPDGARVRFPPGIDPREVFASWLITPQNPWFTRNIANRVWSWLLGRGIIHEPDDICSNHPPSNPALLAYLEKQLIAAHYDLKHLYRLILNSQTYQRSFLPVSNTGTAEAHFAFYPIRRLEAEVVIDAINQITGTTERYTSQIPEPYTFIPENQRTITLADASVTSPFLELFGRSARDTGLESERNNRMGAAQRLHLLNSSHIQRKIQQGPKIRDLLQSKRETPSEKIARLYLTILSRYPTAEEIQTITAYAKPSASSYEASLDLAWALINSAEFLYKH